MLNAYTPVAYTPVSDRVSIERFEPSAIKLAKVLVLALAIIYELQILPEECMFYIMYSCTQPFSRVVGSFNAKLC